MILTLQERARRAAARWHEVNPHAPSSAMFWDTLRKQIDGAPRTELSYQRLDALGRVLFAEAMENESDFAEEMAE